MLDILSVVMRWLSFLCLLQAAGVAMFVAIFGRAATKECVIGRLGQLSAVLGIVAVSGHLLLEPARMAGELAGIVDIGLLKMALQSSGGSASGLRIVGLAIIAVSLRSRDPVSIGTGIVGATVAVMAFTLTGHTSIHPDRWLLAALLVLHLLVVAFWFGGLLPLYLVSLRESRETVAALVDRFSAIAVWLVPGIFLAGFLLTWLLVPNLAVFAQPYGQILIAKVVAFAVLMALAALNKWRIGPAIASGVRSALTVFQRSVATEYVLIAGVLAVTACMTTFFSPE